jgi:hypothetical protein
MYYIVQRRRPQHVRTLTPMNTRTQIMPLWAPPKDCAGGLAYLPTIKVTLELKRRWQPTYVKGALEWNLEVAGYVQKHVSTKRESVDIASHGSKMEGETRHHHQPSVQFITVICFFVLNQWCYALQVYIDTESTEDVSGCRSKACLVMVMGSFSRKGKVAVVLQRIGRFNNMWAGVSSSLDPAKGHVASPRCFDPQRAKLLNCRLFIGPVWCTRVLLEMVWLFLQESSVLTDFYLLHTEPYNTLISSRWRRRWKERAAQSWMQKLMWNEIS